MIHQNLENWNKLNFTNKMADIGSEAIRVMSWGDSKNGEDSLSRFLQLLDLTLKNEKSPTRKNELETLKDYFTEAVKKKNLQSQQQVRNFFIDFALLARKSS